MEEDGQSFLLHTLLKAVGQSISPESIMPDLLIRRLDNILKKINPASNKIANFEDMKKVFHNLSNEKQLFKVLHILSKLKNSKAALMYLEEGKKFIAQDEIERGCDAYTQCIAWSPLGSLQMGLAYGKRSFILFKKKWFTDSLNDVNFALKCHYPDHFKAKLYFHKSSCLIALNPQDRGPIDQALIDTKKWIIKMNDKNRKLLEVMLKDRAELLSSPGNDTPKENHKIDFNEINVPELSGGEHSFIPGFSNAIEYKYSKKYGRHIVASRDIKSGEILFVQKPYIQIIDPKLRYKFCWHCGKRTWSCVPCNGCPEVIYCSELCRDTAQFEYHDLECFMIHQLLSFGPGHNFLLSLRVTILAFKQAGSSLDELRNQVLKFDDTSSEDREKLRLIDGKLRPDKFESIQDLICSSGKIEEKQSSIMLYSIVAATYFLRKLKVIDVIDHCVEVVSLKNNDNFLFLVGFINKNVWITYLNEVSYGMRGENFTVQVKKMILPAFSLINDSCVPMIMLSAHGNYLAARAIRPIEKNEQIYQTKASYIYTLLNRRKINFDELGYVCECEACVNHWTRETLQPILPNTREGKIIRIRFMKFDGKLKAIQSMNRHDQSLHTPRVLLEAAKLVEKAHQLYGKNSFAVLGATSLFKTIVRITEQHPFSLN